MKRDPKQFLLTIAAILSIALCIVFTSCSDDDNDSGSLTMTTEIIIGTWANTSDNITLEIASNGTGTYTSDYYSDPSESITWTISGDKYLTITGTGLFTATYKLKSEDKLEDIFLGTTLTKQ